MLFGALIGPYFIDWTSYRADFEREAARILGHPVKVRGGADARLLPFPSVTFNNVTVGEQSDSSPMMTIERFSLDAELAPFLRGEILIFDMRIEEPDATVRLLPDGRIDWAERVVSASPLNRQLDAVVLENVAISGGRITVVDEQNARRFVVDDVQAGLMAASLQGPWRIEGSGAVAGQRGDFLFQTGRAQDGQIRLRSRLSPDALGISLEMEGQALFENDKPYYFGNFTVSADDPAQFLDLPAEASSGESVERVARLFGPFDLTNERFRSDDYRLEIGVAADPYLVEGEVTIDTGAAPEFPLTARGQQIGMESRPQPPSMGTPARQAGEQATRLADDIDLRERLASLADMVRSVPIPPMSGRVDLSLPAIVAGRTTVRNVRVLAEPDGAGWTISNASAQFPGRTTVETSGRLTLTRDMRYDGHIVVAVSQPTGLASWLHGEIDPAIRRLDSGGFEADVSFSQQVQRFDNLQIILDGALAGGRIERVANALDGQATDRSRGASYSIDLNAETVDLDLARALVRFLEPERKAGNAAPGQGDQTGNRIAARIHTDRLSGFGVEAGDVQAVFTLADGRLSLERALLGDVAGASVGMSGQWHDIDAEMTRANLQLGVRAVDPSGLIALAERLGGSQLRNHPWTARLRKAAAYGENFSGDFELTLGGDAFAHEVRLSGQGEAGGTAFTIELAREDARADWLVSPLRLSLEAENDEPYRLFGQMGFDVLPFALEGPARFSATLDGQAVHGAAFSLDYEAEAARASLAGTVLLDETGLQSGEMDLALNADDWSGYLLALGIPAPGGEFGLAGAARARLITNSRTVLVEDLVAQIEANRIAGEIVIPRNRMTSLPITGTLDLDRVDARWLASVVTGGSADTVSALIEQDTAGPQGGWSDVEFHPPVDGIPDMAFRVRTSALIVDDTRRVNSVIFDLTHGNGEITVRNLVGEGLGGRVSGEAVLSNNAGTVLLSAALSLADGSIAKMLETAGLRSDLATGIADLTLSLEGSGKSPLALVNALAGSGRLDNGQVRVPGLSIAVFPAILAAADAEGFEIEDASVRALVADEMARGSFVLPHPLSVPFTFAGGTARADAITTGHADARISAGFRLSVATGLLDSAIEVSFEPDEDNRVAGTNPSVRLSFFSPASALGSVSNGKASGVVYNVTDLSNYLSVRAFERERRKVERLQASVLEKQRLRREVVLLRTEIARREALRIRDRLILENDARRRAAGRRIEAKHKADEAAARALYERAERALIEAAEKLDAQERERVRAQEEVRIQAEREAAARSRAQALAAQKAEAEARRRAEAAAAAAAASSDWVERGELLPPPAAAVPSDLSNGLPGVPSVDAGLPDPSIGGVPEGNR